MKNALAKVSRGVVIVFGLLVLMAGCAYAETGKETEWVCIGRAFDCAVYHREPWVTPLQIASVVGGILIILFAFNIRTASMKAADMARAKAALTLSLQTAMRTVWERDGGRCRECGTTDNPEAVYRSLPIPRPGEFRRVDPEAMMLLCEAHRTPQTPLVRLAIEQTDNP